MPEDNSISTALYRWLRDGGRKRSAAMFGPDPEYGWYVTIADGQRMASGESKDFTELVNRLLLEMEEKK